MNDERWVLRRQVFWMALPALGEQLLNFCVGLFDTFLAGRIVESTGELGLHTSTVGIAAYMSWLASLLFALVGTGTTALVARHWGARDYAGANRFMNCSILLAGALAIFIYALLYQAAPWYAGMQNMGGDSLVVVVHYLRTDAFGHLFYGFCLVGAAALRGAGDMRTPMFVLGVVNMLNIVVSSVCVFGLGPIEPQGVRGIVFGTVTAHVVGGLLMLGVLFRGVSGLRMQVRQLVPTLQDTARILRIGVPAAVDGGLMWTGHSVFLMIIAHLGDAATGKANLAAHIIGIEVEALTYLPAVAWGYAAGTLIGQYLGAGEPHLAKLAGHEAARQCVLMAIVGSLVYLVGSPWIYQMMTNEPTVRQIGVPALRVLALYQIPLVVMIIYLTGMRGAGDTRSPLLVNVFGIACIRLPLGYLFGIVLNGGLMGAWTAMLIDVFIRALLAAWQYHRGRWTHVKV